MARRSRAHDLPRAQRRRAGSEIVREIVHVVAPNANRFLAEGLAAYAQERLKGQAAFPNHGADAHREVSLLSADPSALAAYVSVLERHATPERLRSDSLDEQQAYLIAGSFVRYLIETVGAENFVRCTIMTPLVPRIRDPGDPDRWSRIYGKPLSIPCAGMGKEPAR